MPTLLENVALTAQQREECDERFREALRAAHENHSWAEIAQECGLSVAGVRYLAANLNYRRKEKNKASKKGEKK